MSGQNDLTAAERRAQPRVRVAGVEVPVLIRFSDVWSSEGGYLEDIGSGGILVRSQDIRPIGSEVTVIFELPNGSHLHVVGRVIHLMRGDPSAPLAGMGIAFCQASPEVTRLITTYLALLERSDQ